MNCLAFSPYSFYIFIVKSQHRSAYCPLSSHVTGSGEHLLVLGSPGICTHYYCTDRDYCPSYFIRVCPRTKIILSRQSTCGSNHLQCVPVIGSVRSSRSHNVRPSTSLSLSSALNHHLSSLRSFLGSSEAELTFYRQSLSLKYFVLLVTYFGQYDDDDAINNERPDWDHALISIQTIITPAPARLVIIPPLLPRVRLWIFPPSPSPICHSQITGYHWGRSLRSSLRSISKSNFIERIFIQEKLSVSGRNSLDAGAGHLDRYDMDLVTEPELDNVGKCNVSSGACPDLRARHVSSGEPSANQRPVLMTNEKPPLATCHTWPGGGKLLLTDVNL